MQNEFKDLREMAQRAVATSTHTSVEMENSIQGQLWKSDPTRQDEGAESISVLAPRRPSVYPMAVVSPCDCPLEEEGKQTNQTRSVARPAHCDTDLYNLRFLCDGVQRKERREKKKVAGSKLAGQCFSKFSTPTNPRDSRLTGTVTDGAEGPVISASLLRTWVMATLLSVRLHLEV